MSKKHKPKYQVTDKGKSYMTRQKMYGVSGLTYVGDYEDWGYTKESAQQIADALNNAEEHISVIKRMLEILTELADDHEAQITVDFPESVLVYPSYKRRYDSARETLSAARAAIADAQRVKGLL